MKNMKDWIRCLNKYISGLEFTVCSLWLVAVSEALNRIVTVQECDATMMHKEQMLVTKN